MGMSLRLANFEIRDTVMWLYGQGVPKTGNISKLIDKHAGRSRTFADVPASEEARIWDDWSYSLKEGHELILLVRKPCEGASGVENALTYGTGALNIGGCRIGEGLSEYKPGRLETHSNPEPARKPPPGRWPANVVIDESVRFALNSERPQRDQRDSGWLNCNRTERPIAMSPTRGKAVKTFKPRPAGRGDYFFCPKVCRKERSEGLVEAHRHPTTKPVELMRWLVRLVTPPGGTVLDPFAGSGTTGVACQREGFSAILIEREAEYVGYARARNEATRLELEDATRQQTFDW